jgi:AcrR family transcriptional regulator
MRLRQFSLGNKMARNAVRQHVICNLSLRFVIPGKAVLLSKTIITSFARVKLYFILAQQADQDGNREKRMAKGSNAASKAGTAARSSAETSVKVAAEARSQPLRRRLAPEDRARMILEGAIIFFAERGFEGQIRDLADTLGVSQALIFTYFGNKGTLLERVYDEVFLSRWRDTWLDDLRDRAQPLQARLEAFYLSYLDAIDEPIWIRIVLHSGLAGNELTTRYVSRRVEEILQTLMVEVRSDFGSALATMEDADLYERIWDLQASFIYSLIRKHVWQLPVMEDRPRLVAGRVEQFLRGLSASV